MDRPFPPTFRILADINITGNGYRIQKSVAPLLLALFIERCSRHNSHYVACFRQLLHRSIVASFSGGPSRDQPRKPRGERGGERGGFHPARWRFLLGAASARTFLSRTRPGKRKGEVFTLGLPFHSC